jgi:hypothetical protein
MSVPTLPPRAIRDGQHDFDFFFGSWTSRNRRLRNPLTGSSEWVEFEGHLTTRPIWGGRANYEEAVIDDPRGRILGFTLRVYDPKSGQWSILWASSNVGIAWPLLVGEFRDGRGEFYDQETFNGRTIWVRFLWTETGPDRCRNEQAFSEDHGKSWETNWTTEFTREPDPPTRRV